MALLERVNDVYCINVVETREVLFNSISKLTPIVPLDYAQQNIYY